MTSTTVMDAHSDWPYITVVSAAGHVHRATAGDAGFPGDFRWYAGMVYDEMTNTNDEGITWIRGWHDDASAAVQAMLAARALVGKKTVDLADASLLFVSGQWNTEQWRSNLDQWEAEFAEDSRRQR